MSTRRVIVRKLMHVVPVGEPLRRIVKRRATPDEIRQLQTKFLLRLARMVRRHADKAWLLDLSDGWFVHKDSGFQAEFKRLGRLAERAILRAVRELEEQR